MEDHPSFPAIRSFIAKYPRAAGAIFQTYNDIVYSQKWEDVQLIDLEACQRVAIRGRRKDTDKALHAIPCSLYESLSYNWLQASFKQPDKPTEIYLAITSDDASIVYYKISQGIVKPLV